MGALIIGKQRERQPSKRFPSPEQRISEPGNTGSREKVYNFTKHPQKQRFSAFPASPEIAPNGSAFLFGNQLVLKTDPSVQSGRTLNREVGIVNQLWEEKFFQVAVGDEAISTDRICCLRKVLGKTLLISLPQTSPQKYLLPYRDQLSSQGTLYRVLLSPKSQDHFFFLAFW